MTATRLFGTDGVRGVVGDDLTLELVARLGRAFARWSDGSPVLVGRDTRASGPALVAALSEGLTAGGSPVRDGGVLPTPAVALLADACGSVVSASHNPPEYNGVKFFDAGGFKLAEADEERIETLLAAGPAVAATSGGRDATQADTTERRLGDRYVELVTRRFGTQLAGLRIACDCANGAMSGLAPAAFERLGAAVTAVANEPDGTNINVGCGATDLSLLTSVVRGGAYDVGVAFDGDGDRILAVDADGDELDGDRILTVLAFHLGVQMVAVSATTNVGFHRVMRERGVRVVTTDVGDRHVLEALRREGGVLGGEQSGHLIFLDGQTTGDGLAAGLLLARAVVESGRPLSELAAQMPAYPQARANVPVRSKELPQALVAEVERLNAELGERGRVLVRPSGTEPVVRVLAEAETDEAAERLCASIGALAKRELG